MKKTIKSIDAADYSRRIDHTHMHGGKPAFAVILSDIVSHGVSGDCSTLRKLWQRMSREARDHGWLKDSLYLDARRKVLETNRAQIKQLDPLPANVLDCLCGAR